MPLRFGYVDGLRGGAVRFSHCTLRSLSRMPVRRGVAGSAPAPV